VRTTDPRVAPLLEQAAAGSTTLRQQIAAIDANDGLVYVGVGESEYGSWRAWS
jgi:hypothetical protein